MAVVSNLEDKLRRWQEDLPPELRIETCKPGSQVFALYTQTFCLELRVCLRHPSVCMTSDPVYCAENTRICEETASDLLNIVEGLRTLKSIDTTWYQMSVYVAAMFTTLVGHWERRYRITPGEVAKLKKEMDNWLVILGESGTQMGKSNNVQPCGFCLALTTSQVLAFVFAMKSRSSSTVLLPG